MCRGGISAIAFGLALSLVLAGTVEADITTGLVGYWPLDGDAQDASGNELHGTINGNVTPAPDRFGYPDSAMSFAGDAASNITVADVPLLNITGEMTLAAWVFLTGGQTNNARVIAKAGGGGARSWSLNIENDSGGVRYPATFQIGINGGASNLSTLDTQPLPTDEWVHMTGIYRPGEVTEVYVNAELRATNTTNIPPNQHSDNGLSMMIGSRNACSNCTWNGFIDEARVYARSLSPEDVTELFGFHPAPRVKAWGPSPADGAQGVTSQLFQWKSGVTAVLHDVYVGTTPELTEADLVSRRAPGTIIWYAPGLTPGVTYFWRVDEIEADLTTVHTGDVWSFTAAPLTAYNPQPYDKARWVDPNADLSWTAGLNAIIHELYFGTDEATVLAGTGGTFKSRQGGLTFDPGPLPADTTHFWRVDEIDASTNVRTGPLWSFTTLGPGGGVKGEYFASMDLSGAPAETRIEDQIDFTWPDGTTLGTNSPGASVPTNGFSCRWTADLQVDRADAYTLVTRSDDGVRVYLDGVRVISNWTDHAPVDNASAPLDLVPGRVYSLVMEMYENTGGAAARLSWESPSMGRRVITRGPLQPPLHAGMPAPADGAVNVPQDTLLSWRAGDEAGQHDVYLGDDAQAVADATTASTTVYRARQALASTTFDPGELEWGKTYYWRIDEVGASGTQKGSVWSFTAADFLVVDDFESYTDEKDTNSRIYETWLDGWVNDNGSQVGYTDPPFAELAIVHSGNQSMPMDYNNVVAPYYYSEAERSWDTAQDWTINGVDTLTLYIRGRTSNTPDQLYVVLEDSTGRAATVVYPDAGIFTRTNWTEWQIPLSQFTGVNAAKVKKMTIGVGDRANAVPAGAGRLFIDDIRVTRPVNAE